MKNFKYFSGNFKHDVHGCKLLTFFKPGDMNLNKIYNLIKENEINFTPSALLYVAQKCNELQSVSVVIPSGNIFSNEVELLIDRALHRIEKESVSFNLNTGKYTGHFLPQSEPDPHIQFVFHALQEKPARVVVKCRQFVQILDLVFRAYANNLPTILSICSSMSDNKLLLEKCKIKFGDKIVELINEAVFEKLKHLRPTDYKTFELELLQKVKNYFNKYVTDGAKEFDLLLRNIKLKHKTKRKLMEDLKL